MSADDTDSRWPTDDDLDTSTDEVPVEDRPVPPELYGAVAGFVLLLAAVFPLMENTAVGAASAMLFSGVLFAAAVISFGVPPGTGVDGLVGGAVLAVGGGLVVHAASLAGAVSGPTATALFWMAVWVGAIVGFLGRVTMVATRSSAETPP